MNVPEFQAKWRHTTLTERAAAQSHFIDVCRLVGHETPAEMDPDGRRFTFEKGLTKTGGGGGFADVWYRRHFGWEYKKPGEDLEKAYRQLKLYAEALENPPLLIVSDIQRIVVHTNFTNTTTETHEIALDELDDKLAILRNAFYEPDALKPGTTTDKVTEAAAARFGKLAAALHGRGVEPHRAAHFLVQMLFCLFAEDVGLLRRGLFTDLLALGAQRPDATDAELKKRTLTNLYNAHPAWLANLHAALDRAVWDAYGWDDPDPATVPEDEILARLLALNEDRAGA
jgi:hypothetical protein